MQSNLSTIPSAEGSTSLPPAARAFTPMTATIWSRRPTPVGGVARYSQGLNIAICVSSTPWWLIRNHSREFVRPVALQTEFPLRILASRPIFGPGGWVARPRPPFWPHFSRLRDAYRRTMLHSRPLHELSWQRRILHAPHACTGRDERLPKRRSAF